ncbi:TetR/AcrR family transcriptional regulator [Bacillus atrophaeus]
MNEKKEKIIKTGIHLFAKKGFSSTTIQEIASECGISKGAFYLHFKSKEALLLSACEYYISMSMDNMQKIKEKHHHLPPKEVFKKQITHQLQEFLEHRDFIVLLLSENVIPENQKLKQYFHNANIEFNKQYRMALVSSYGDRIAPFLSDISIMAQGIVNSYINLLIFNEQIKLDFEHLSQFIMDRLDDLIYGLIQSGKKAILPEEIFRVIPAGTEQVLKEIRKVKENGELSDDLMISLEVLEEEFSKEEPRKPIIKGMLSNLTASNDEEIAQLHSIISGYISECRS